MNKTILAAAIFGVMLAAADSARAAQAECSERELAAGTPMPDGTVAGEVQTLAYLKTNEPELYKKLGALDAAVARRRFAKQYEWFQRVGRCRQRQKREALLQLKSELRILEQARGGATGELRTSVEESFDSDLAMLDIELQNAKGALQELAREVDRLSAAIAQRRQGRTAIIERRIQELTRK